MKLVFASCVRDCAKVLKANIASILKMSEMPWCDGLLLYIAENNSRDNTRDLLLELSNRDRRIIPILLDDLDEIMPVREERIAFCRDRLLDEITKLSTDALYVPIDLDSTIASSLKPDSFGKACLLVASGQCSGVFPSSFPFYYDIHALRHPEWCPSSCWMEIKNAKANGAFWSMPLCIRYVYSRQLSYLVLQSKGLIPVDSAFGGIGVYSLKKVAQAGASYSSPNLKDRHLCICEHVVFNGFLDSLCIFPDWLIEAPCEHIRFNMSSPRRRLLIIMRTGMGDIKRLIFNIAKRLSDLVRRNLG